VLRACRVWRAVQVYQFTPYPQDARLPAASATVLSSRQLPDDYFIPDLCHDRAVLVCAGLAQLLVVVFALGGGAVRPFDWAALGMASVFVQWIVLFSAGLLCLLRAGLRRGPLWVASSAAIGVPLAVTGFSSAIAQWMLAPGYLTLDRWWLVRNLLVALIFSGVTFRYFYLQFMVRQRERAALQARLDGLRSRIRPHFLFNTMNSIASLIAIAPEAAETAVEDLSELLRASLRDSDDDRHTVADELRLCELYLRIEQLRLGERLCVEWHVQDTCRSARMPSLVLQPLVENAVYHGIARLPEGGEISIGIAAMAGQLVATLRNPVPGPGNDAGFSGNQMALANIRARLDGMFGSAASLETDLDGKVFAVRLCYPLERVQISGRG